MDFVHKIAIMIRSKNPKFKSPSSSSSDVTKHDNHVESDNKSTVSEDAHSTTHRLEALRARVASVDEEIGELTRRGISVHELDTIVHKLHVYNETKDVGLELLNKLAHIHQTTIKQMYANYDIDLQND